MSGGQRFRYTIDAEDKSAAIVEKANKRIGDLSKPAAQAEAGLKKVADSGSLGSIAKSLDTIGSSAKVALGTLGGFIGITGASSAFSAINGMFTDMAALGRQAMGIGIDPEKLQELQGAFRRVGGSAEGMSDAVASLATNMRKARVGENDLALGLADKHGINLERMADGTFDTVSAMLRIADVYKAILRENGPQAADAFAQVFGVEGIAQLLREGSGAMQQLMTDTRATGVIMHGEALQGAMAYKKAMAELEDSIWGVVNALSAGAKPTVTAWMQNMKVGLDMARDNPRLFAYGMLQPIDDWAQRQADSLNSLFGHDPDEVKRRYGRQGLTEMFFGGGKNGRPTFDAGSTNPTAGIAWADLTTEDFLAAAKRRPIETAHSGSVHVDIKLTGAPPGTVSSVRSTGNVNAQARVETSMPGYGP